MRKLFSFILGFVTSVKLTRYLTREITYLDNRKEFERWFKCPPEECSIGTIALRLSELIRDWKIYGTKSQDKYDPFMQNIVDAAHAAKYFGHEANVLLEWLFQKQQGRT